jgi:hypothetical protein
MICQIEFVSSDSDLATPCSKLSAHVRTAGRPFVPTAARGAVDNHSVRYVVMTTQQIPASASRFKTSATRFQLLFAQPPTRRASPSLLSLWKPGLGLPQHSSPF